VLAIAFAPAIYTWCWHETHSGVSDFAGYAFTVPRDFVPVGSPAGLKFIHGQTRFDADFYRLSGITIDQTGHRLDLSRWESTITHSAAQLGLGALETFRTTMGGTPAACYQTHLQADWVLVCDSQDGIAVIYAGDFAHIPEARAMLEGARKL
jgi:hypothetical protein